MRYIVYGKDINLCTIDRLIESGARIKDDFLISTGSYVLRLDYDGRDLAKILADRSLKIEEDKKYYVK